MSKISQPIKATGVIGALLISAPMMSFPTFAIAQDASAEAINEVQDMLAWMNQATEISVALTDLFQTDMMAKVYASLDSDDFATIRATGREYEAMRNRVLPTVRARIDALPAPERWNIDPTLFDPQERALFRAAQTQYDTMEDLYEKVSEMTESLSTMLTDLEEIDDATLLKLVSSQQDMGIAMIRIENQQVRAYLAAIPKENPNHQFQRLILQTNLAVIEEISIPVDEDLKARQKAAKQILRALRPTDDIIADGRKNYVTSAAQLKAFIDGPGLNTAEKAFIEKAYDAMSNFPEQFDVEEDMVERIRQAAELYASDQSDADIQSKLSEIELERFALIDQRVALATSRLSRMQ